MSDIYQRKRDHLELCRDGAVEARPGGLFEQVQLVHDALPELSMADVRLQTPFLDHQIAAPLMITGMTGGPAEAGEINRQLAVICAEVGIPLGLGSQRVMLKAPESTATFQVKKAAPDVLLIGNLGVNQCRDLGPTVVRELMARVEADYMAIHLNPAMELIQPGADADRDFRRGYETIARLVDVLDGRLLVKECGTGLSPAVVEKLVAVGVRAVDISGNGGTSWVKVEALRAEGQQARLGALFADWGLPTAAATALAAPYDVQVIASGGIGEARTAAKALALGADLVGVARPVLQALAQGPDAARRFIDDLLVGLRMALALTGCKTPGELRYRPRIIGRRLQDWLDQGGPR